MIRRAYFLGAGFSKAINPGYPTLAELSAIVDRNLRARHTTGAIRAHLDQIPAQLRSDFEQLLSYLYSNWPWKSSADRHLDNALYEALVYEIWIALAHLPLTDISEDQRDFIQFLRVIDSNSVISVNYDNLIEDYKTNARSARDLLYHFSGIAVRVEERFETSRKTSKQQPFFEEPTGDEKNPLRYYFAREWLSEINEEEFCAKFLEFSKNHPKEDSRNQPWNTRTTFRVLTNLAKPGASKTGLWDFEVSAGKVLQLHGSLLQRSKDGNQTIRIIDPDGGARLERIPTLVPPVMDKSRHYASNELMIVWNHAHEAIRRAEEIVIVGFSFPPTDISCQFLFKSAIQSGTRVVVVNKDPNVIQRYEAVFSEVDEVKLDFAYVGGDDPLSKYIATEILRTA